MALQIRKAPGIRQEKAQQARGGRGLVGEGQAPTRVARLRQEAPEVARDAVNPGVRPGRREGRL